MTTSDDVQSWVTKREITGGARTYVHYRGSYEALVPQRVEVVEPEDLVSSRDPRDTDVWFTEWQVSEDGLNVEVGRRVEWAVVPMDQNWVARLFAGRRAIPLQLDTYDDAWQNIEDLSERALLSGRVTRIDQISVRYQPSKDPVDRGMLGPDTGGAMQHTVPSLRQARAHHGTVVGWIVRVRS
jgi:hypothetical protein